MLVVPTMPAASTRGLPRTLWRPLLPASAQHLAVIFKWLRPPSQTVALVAAIPAQVFRWRRTSSCSPSIRETTRLACANWRRKQKVRFRHQHLFHRAPLPPLLTWMSTLVIQTQTDSHFHPAQMSHVFRANRKKPAPNRWNETHCYPSRQA